MKKLKSVERYIDGIIILLAMGVALSVIVTVDRDNKLKAENKELKQELKTKKKTLKETNERLAVFENYLRDVEMQESNIVTDKYTNGHDYTIKVGKDYYSVDYERYMNTAIGQPVDASGWEKAE